MIVETILPRALERLATIEAGAPSNIRGRVLVGRATVTCSVASTEALLRRYRLTSI